MLELKEWGRELQPPNLLPVTTAQPVRHSHPNEMECRAARQAMPIASMVAAMRVSSLNAILITASPFDDAQANWSGCDDAAWERDAEVV